MCDIYLAECQGCGKKVDTHIGDFSVSQGHIRMYCSKKKCREKALDDLCGNLNGYEIGGQHIVFSSVPCKAIKGQKDKAILYLVDYPRGVSTNE